METDMRFSTLQIKDGPWVVVDRLDHRRRTASRVDAGAAEMITALMNGDFERAVACRDAIVSYAEASA
jgi:hypothetical protein